MGGLAGGGGGSPRALTSRGWGCPPSRGHHGGRLGPPKLFPNCQDRRWARGDTGEKGWGFFFGGGGGGRLCVWTLGAVEGGRSRPKASCNRGISAPVSSSARRPPLTRSSLEPSWKGGNQDFNHISIHIPGRMQLSPGLER